MGTPINGGGEIDLSALIVSARIDFITLRTDGKVKLPKLRGRPIWPREHHGTRLTVHDLTPGDFDALKAHFGNLQILELEVCVDFKRKTIGGGQGIDPLLSAVKEMAARCLDPSAGKLMRASTWKLYRRIPGGFIMRPFNLSPPKVKDELLYGWRPDPVQVKVYWKQRNDGRTLNASQESIRLEVSLRLGGGLEAHELSVLEDLQGFRFRKNLSPYFRHKLAVSRFVPGKDRGSLKEVLAKGMEKYDKAEFDRVGVPAFRPGGKRTANLDSVRFKRAIEINDRIGQALHRLQHSFSQIRVRTDSCRLQKANAGADLQPVQAPVYDLLRIPLPTHAQGTRQRHQSLPSTPVHE